MFCKCLPEQRLPRRALLLLNLPRRLHASVRSRPRCRSPRSRHSALSCSTELAQRGFTLGQEPDATKRARRNGQIGQLGEIVKGMKADQLDAVVVTGFPAAACLPRWRICRRSSRWAPAIRSPPTSSRSWRIPAATSQAFRMTRRRSPPNACADQAGGATICIASPCCGTRTISACRMRYERRRKRRRSIGVMVQPLGVREPDDFNERLRRLWTVTRPTPS